MEYPRRAFLHLAGAAALPALLRGAQAQPIVLRRTRMLIPLPPGGGVDVYAKLIADHMAKDAPPHHRHRAQARRDAAISACNTSPTSRRTAT